MFNSSEIAALKEQNTKLTADYAAAVANHTAVAAELVTATASLAAIQTEKATLETSVSDLTTKLSASDAAKIEAEAKAAAAESSVDAKVNERLASAGVDPVKRDPSAKQCEMQQAPNASLPPLQRAASAVGNWSAFAKK
jgi:uncharacterized protein YkwD